MGERLHTGLRTPRTLFRVAAGPRIGFGHLVRARSLARALGVRPVCAVRGGEVAVDTARRLGCRVLPDTPDRTLATHAPEVLVIDDPQPVATARWVAAARSRGIAVAALVDRGVGARDADLGIDGALGRPVVANAARRWLRGPEYMVLDPAFATVRCATPGRSRCSVVIALGGGVHARYGHRVRDLLIRQLGVRSVYVAPGFTTHGARSGLRSSGLSSPGRKQARRLAHAVVALVAGGVSLYEACCLGVPTIAVSVVPAQRRTVRAFARVGAVVDAGMLGPVSYARAEWLALQVRRLLDDPGRRARLARRASRLVDGDGGRRVSDAVCRLTTARAA